MSENCRVCGRRLTAPESVKRGIGPVCVKNIMTKMEADLILSRFTDIEKEAED